MPRAKPSGFAESPHTYEAPETKLASVGPTRLKIDSAGRVVIPAEMRAAMIVKAGDTVTAKVIDGEFRIVSPSVALKRFQAIGKALKAKHPDVSLVDELIHERREEARREAEEADQWRRERGLPPLE